MYLSVIVTNRMTLFWTIVNLCFVWKVRELRGTVGYISAGRMIFLYSMSFFVGLDLRIFSASRDAAHTQFCFWWLSTVIM